MSAGAIVTLADVRDAAEITDSADVVIVGTGAAGATVARVLTDAGLDVVLVEEGEPPPATGFARDAYTALKSYWRDVGFQVATGRTIIPVIQGRAVGGTTVINGAIMHRMPEAIRAAWQGAGAIDERLGEAPLERAFAQLEAELSIAPTPADVLGGNNALMAAGVAGIGATGNVIARNVSGCRGSGRCAQGCPTGRKQSMHVTYIPRAVRAGARVYASCLVERAEVRGGRAVGVIGRFRRPLSGEQGPRLRVTARRAVVLAASAIQTPLLLAASGVTAPLVGARLQAHPGTSVIGLFESAVDPWFGATQGYESMHFWHERMKFEAVGAPFEVNATRLPGFGAAYMRRLANYGHIAQWGVQVRAEAHGSVRRGLFGRTRIRYDLTRADVGRFKVGVRRLIEMMFAAGAREVWPGVHGLPTRLTSPDQARRLDDLPADPRSFHFMTAHVFGTAAMHSDPRHGVVGPDGQTHAVRSLYVMDSSLFPTNLGVNPQLSISAVAWCLAARLGGA